MDISRFFIDRPRFAGVLSIFIFLVGKWVGFGGWYVIMAVGYGQN